MCVPSADPDSVVRRQAALEASRRRLQEEQDARAAEFRERQQRVSVTLHAAAVCLTVLTLLPLICLAGGGQEKTENRDVGEHEGGKELQGKGTSCTSKSPVTNVSRCQVLRLHIISHFQQSTEEATSSSSPRPKTDKKPLRNSGTQVLHLLL